MRPSHFLSLRVSDPKLHKRVIELQNGINAVNSNYKPCFVDVRTSHITLGVLTLNSKKDFVNASKAMKDSIRCIMDESFEGKKLKFQGLNDFDGKVLYIDVKKDDSFNYLLSIVTILRACFKQNEIPIKDEGVFTPHLTIWKYSRNSSAMHKARISKINPFSYKQYKDCFFGEEIISKISLCSMSQEKLSDGYYVEHASICIGSGQLNHIKDYDELHMKYRKKPNWVKKGKIKRSVDKAVQCSSEGKKDINNVNFVYAVSDASTQTNVSTSAREDMLYLHDDKCFKLTYESSSLVKMLVHTSFIAHTVGFLIWVYL